MDPSLNSDLPTPRTLDTSGTFCPIPIIETARVMGGMAPGDRLLVIATDPGIESDLPAWCRSTRNQFLGLQRRGAQFQALLQKA
jgi:tRNA 2-thiouridine synthesizing protein A